MSMSMNQTPSSPEAIATVKEVTAARATCLQVTLPNSCDQQGSWVAEFRNYSAPLEQGAVPSWLPFSREASHEKKIQLTTPEDLVTEICQDLLREVKSRFNSASVVEPNVNMPESLWQVAVAILHIARIRPDTWNDLISAEFLKQLRRERRGCVPFFARKVIMAWRAHLRQRRKRPSQLRDGPVVAAVDHSAVLPRCYSSKPPTGLPPMARFTPAAKEELERMVAAVTASSSVLDENIEDLNEQQFDKIRALARDIAQQKGSRLVHYRDVRRSAEILDANLERKDKPSPAEETPEHIDEVVDKLSALKAEQLRLSRGG